MTIRQAIRSALSLLTRRDRRLLGVSVVIQMGTSLLDLIGVLLIGLVGALSVTVVQSQPAPAIVVTVSELLGLQDLSDQALVAVFAIAAAVVLLTKSIASSYLTRRVLVFLANRQALVSARLIRELLSRPLVFIQKRSSQETSFALINGAGYATSHILGHMVIAATELALLVVLGVALLLISPWIALIAIGFFAVVAFGLQRAMGSWAARVGAISAQADIASLNAIQEAIGTYREIYVANRRALYVDRIQNLRWQAAKVAADTQFISMFPKYMFEVALVIGGFALAGLLFTTSDSVTAVGTLALFLAAGTRVMPALLRLQGATLGLRGAAGAAGPTFDLARELDSPETPPVDTTDTPAVTAVIESGYPGFVPSVTIESVSVAYPGSTQPALDDVSLAVAPGQSVALVGPSGAGKSSLADVILGVLEPDAGRVHLGGQPPAHSVAQWPGAIAYVPQHVMVVNGTIRDNVALGLPADAMSDALVWDALEKVHLADYLRDNRLGLDTEVGEHGVTLSGGQRQRIGIARALYTRPRLLVLDEATSSLDATTEQTVTETIAGLGGAITTVVIAHRLSTVREVDTVVYLEDGRIVCQGTFEYVVEQVPRFAQQATIMGLA